MTDQLNTEASPGCAVRARGVISYCVFVASSVPALLLGVLGGMGPVDALRLFLVLLVLGLVVLWIVVKPLSALGRWLSGRVGGHRVLWALFATAPLLAAVLTPLWLLWEQDAARGMSFLVLVLLLPTTAAYAALRPVGLRRSRLGSTAGRAAGAAALVALDLEDAPVIGDGPAARQTGRVQQRDRRVLAAVLVSDGDRGRVLHRERTPKLWSAAVVGAAAAGFTLMFVSSDPEDYGIALFLSLLFLVLFVLPLLASPFLKFLNKRIRLTDRTLRVGRHAVGLDRLLPETAAVEPHPRSADRLRQTVQLGGAAGGSTPVGYTPVSVRTRAGDLLGMDSRRPEELVRALHGLAAHGNPQHHLGHPGHG
ncbi:hypothetical protein SAMN05421803_12278 [Nocardiopsis flavescens]|uniref:Uncharacterized protein n=1 Tax=Nocardiopsis flavescens TaxID=758803 RepID=A0A1M6T7W4_9ACTN|nr:hypothetical protein [Nocardiopsis flavescens]SHK53043.1 hypothetical protein SAMN05421803_12278 [Nocardiopsis flavescens]